MAGLEDLDTMAGLEDLDTIVVLDKMGRTPVGDQGLMEDPAMVDPVDLADLVSTVGPMDLAGDIVLDLHYLFNRFSMRRSTKTKTLKNIVKNPSVNIFL